MTSTTREESKKSLLDLWKIPEVLEEIPCTFVRYGPAKTGTKNLVSGRYSLETLAEFIEFIER